MRRAPSGFEQNVFINCPFDRPYRSLRDAIIFAVQIAGFKPRCALEASDAGQVRLAKIMDILAECQYGVHDISRTALGENGLPRFNMPLELGLDLGCRRFGSGFLTSKRLLVLDKEPYRYQQFLSDIAGQDVMSHSNNSRTLIREVRNWLATESKQTTIPGGDYMFTRYGAFRKSLPALCQKLKLTQRQLTFGDLSHTIRIWLEENEI
jgi:hypothetical protein